MERKPVVLTIHQSKMIEILEEHLLKNGQEIKVISVLPRKTEETEHEAFKNSFDAQVVFLDDQ